MKESKFKNSINKDSNNFELILKSDKEKLEYFSTGWNCVSDSKNFLKVQRDWTNSPDGVIDIIYQIVIEILAPIHALQILLEVLQKSNLFLSYPFSDVFSNISIFKLSRYRSS